MILVVESYKSSYHISREFYSLLSKRVCLTTHCGVCFIPKENEVIVFEDFFVAGLRIPPHPVLLEILHKF
jgi:hypothetical protein